MKKLLKLSLLLLLSQGVLHAVENHQVGFKLGLTSIDNEDGWTFENGSIFADLTFDIGSTVKPRVDLGYISIDEDENDGVGSLWQLAVNGIYDLDLNKYYRTSLQPYLLGGLGYEYVPDDTPVFESHPFIQAGFGARYPLTDRVTLVSEFRALQMFGSSDEDNEFALMVGIDVPLFVEVIRGSVDKNVRQLPEISAPIATQTVQYQEPIISDGDGDGIPNSIDNCPNTPVGDRVNDKGCTIVSSIILPEEVSYLEDTGAQPVETVSEVVVQKNSFTKRKRQNIKVGFESNSAVIKSSSKVSVKRFADFLKNNPSLNVTIEGYTDNSGNRAKNLSLSTKRAQSVRALLIKYGANASKIKAVGKGDLNPIANNETASGREINRRIEVVIH